LIDPTSLSTPRVLVSQVLESSQRRMERCW
jgi:hypothetical protein